MVRAYRRNRRIACSSDFIAWTRRDRATKAARDLACPSSNILCKATAAKSGLKSELGKGATFFFSAAIREIILVEANKKITVSAWFMLASAMTFINWSPWRKLVLGGVEIPHTKGLDGHSDADALMHAICDALLGALGEPDIGHFFPEHRPALERRAQQNLFGRSRAHHRASKWKNRERGRNRHRASAKDLSAHQGNENLHRRGVEHQLSARRHQGRQRTNSWASSVAKKASPRWPWRA